MLMINIIYYYWWLSIVNYCFNYNWHMLLLPNLLPIYSVPLYDQERLPNYSQQMKIFWHYWQAQVEPTPREGVMTPRKHYVLISIYGSGMKNIEWHCRAMWKACCVAIPSCSSTVTSIRTSLPLWRDGVMVFCVPRLCLPAPTRLFLTYYYSFSCPFRPLWPAPRAISQTDLGQISLCVDGGWGRALIIPIAIAVWWWHESITDIGDRQEAVCYASQPNCCLSGLAFWKSNWHCPWPWKRVYCHLPSLLFTLCLPLFEHEENFPNPTVFPVSIFPPSQAPFL